MGLYGQTAWVLAVLVCAFWTRNCAHGRPELPKSDVEVKKELRPCSGKIQPGVQKGSNSTKDVTSPPCDPDVPPPVKGTLDQLPVTSLASKQNSVTDERSLEMDGPESSFAETYPKPKPKKEDLSGGKTGFNSDEILRSEVEAEEEEGLGDSLAPNAPYPEMDAGGHGGEGPATTEDTEKMPDQDIMTNDHFPDEKKSELFIDSGIFPFIAMGVLSVLFISMMIAALYFARHSSDVQNTQISMKHVGTRTAPVPDGEASAFNAVLFRNAKDAVMVNVFAVRQDEREEAKRELTDATESTLVATPANIADRRVAAESAAQEAMKTTTTLLNRDLPDVVSGPSSRRETMSNNRHSTGSSLYMELMNMCRNTRLLEELALRRKNIRMQDASQLDEDCTFSSGTECSIGKMVVRRQASLDSARCRDSVPLPYTYEPHYLKLYGGDDDDSSALASASANTTLDTVMFSSDESCAGTLSGLHRKGSSKRNSRLLDESRQLLPVQEFFNEALIDSSDGDNEDVLYESIDEMGYRRRTASSRAIRRLMAARESAGQAGETVVVENAWEASPKKYDKLDRGIIKAYRKQIARDKDYNTLVV